jgi:hypothetical protein
MSTGGRIDGRKFKQLVRQQQVEYVERFLDARVTFETQPSGVTKWMAVRGDAEAGVTVQTESYSIAGLVFPESNTERATRTVAHQQERAYRERVRRHRQAGLDQLDLFGGNGG